MTGGAPSTTGGASAIGGAPTTGGASAIGGAPTTGGASATGGAAPTTGGASAIGGAPTTGGASATGGMPATGGIESTGGMPATGGTEATGGMPATGGTEATGGAEATGGMPATGGTEATGGAEATGGTEATGGSEATGGTPGTGGTTATGVALADGWETAAVWCGDGLSKAPTPCTYPRIFASSVQNVDANTPQQAFDGTTTGSGNIWVSGLWAPADWPQTLTPVTLGVEFAEASIINSVTLYGRLNSDRAYNPSDYTIETSDTGVDGSWTVQATLSRSAGTTWPIGSDTAYYVSTPIATTFVPPLVAKWIRISISATYYQQKGVDVTPGSANGFNTQVCELRIR